MYQVFPNFVWLTPWCSAVNKYIILLLEEAADVNAVVVVELVVVVEEVVVWALADVIIIDDKSTIVIIIIGSITITNVNLANTKEHQIPCYKIELDS
jgi:hypothetical protein